MTNQGDSGQADWVETYRLLRKAQSSTHEAIVCAKKGLNRNPKDEEGRALDSQILKLAERNAILQQRLLTIAAEKSATKIPMPSQSQVDAIGALSRQVEELTNDRLTAAAALALAMTALRVATDLTSAKPA